MTPALRKMLQAMADAEDRGEYEDAEAVCDRLQVWVGDEQYSWRTIMAGIRLMALRDVSDVKGARRYTINSVGRLLLRSPDQADRIREIMIRGGSWTIKGDEVVEMKLPDLGNSG